MSTRSQISTLITEKILTGGRRTTASNAREVYVALNESCINKTDDANVNNGYLAIDNTGKVDVSFIKKTTPTGQFLKDDGTWADAGGAVDSVNGQTGVVVLTASDVGAPSGSGSSTGTNTGDQDLSGYVSRNGSSVFGEFELYNSTFELDTTYALYLGDGAILSTSNSTAEYFTQIVLHNSDEVSELAQYIRVASSDPLFAGIQYVDDYSANYTNRSLVDKEYVTTLLSTKEPTIIAGTTSQYFRGDKTWQTLDKTIIGLENVPNVDATNPANISQSATYRFVSDTEKNTWNAKAPINSPTFTGTPAAPTATVGTNTTQIATTAFVLANASSNSVVYKTIVKSAVNTGTNLEEKLTGILIPANTIKVGDILEIKMKLDAIGTAGAKSFYGYINTSDSLSGALPVIRVNSSANSQIQNTGRRLLLVKSSSNTEHLSGATSSVNDYNTFTGAVASSNIDWTIDQYFIPSIQNGSSADSSWISMILITKI